MRATKIQFAGYRRLKSTQCNVDARLVAFLGPNEAGKSSVLNGLEWFDSDAFLMSKDRFRPAKPADAAEVVTVSYALTDLDGAALRADGVEIEEFPESIVCSRTAGGSPIADVRPHPRRRRVPFLDAATKLAACIETIEAGVIEPGSGIDTVRLTELLVAGKEALAEPDEVWPEQSAVHRAAAALDEALQVRVEDESEPSALPWAAQFADCGEAVRHAVTSNALPHPEERVRELLWQRRPAFLQFTSADRDLRQEYNIADEALRADPPRALVNILRVAGCSVNELWLAIQDDDRTAFKSLEGSLNSTLEERIRPSWHQSQLTLELDVDMTGLAQIIVRDLETSKNQPRVVVSERSDGLRTFLALSCFLGARDLNQPPILLIDEAETHLHVDAQADLITLLATDAQVSQVFYTTHSPGCLPQDLGTSLRFVSRDEKDRHASVLTNSFWSNDSPGFSRLLFAMGAGAAAFSAFRRAVICEGPSEMILLPTLFRAAREGKPVEFQVAPGLSSASELDPALRGIAVDTAFLVDGDDGGRTLAAKLTQAGYDADAIFPLPDACAIEDLLVPDFYLDVVDGLMRESGSNATVDRASLDTTLSIAKAVDAWAAANSIRVPGHVLVAVRLAAEPTKIQLTTDAAAALRALYDQLTLRLGQG